MSSLLAAVLAVLLPLAPSATAPVAPLTVAATNTLPVAREAQTIELTRAQLSPLGEKDLWKIHVADESGRPLVVQAVDTDGDDLHTPDIVIFQSDFGPNQRKTFTVTTGARPRLRVEDYRAYGRFVRERFDDYAWENDRIAHRTYGKALETWKGEPLTSSAIDIWSKLGPRLSVNEWYMMGDAFYHTMNENGGDFYSAGPTRGDGGPGLWAQDRLWASANFVASRTLASGPIRVLFELDYPPFDVAGQRVTEVLRVSLDAGSQLDHYTVTFRPEHPGATFTGAVGLKKVAGEVRSFEATTGILSIWEPVEKQRGMQGVAVIVDPKSLVGPAEDEQNDLLRVRLTPANTMDYSAGFAWDRAGRITSDGAWRRYVEEFARDVRTPIVVTVSGS